MHKGREGSDIQVKVGSGASGQRKVDPPHGLRLVEKKGRTRILTRAINVALRQNEKSE